MYIDTAIIIACATLLTALATIGTFGYKAIKWFQAQERQTKDIAALNEETCLLTYAILACLKGLKEQGCNGPVTEAIDKVEKHINKKAHGQEE